MTGRIYIADKWRTFELADLPTAGQKPKSITVEEVNDSIENTNNNIIEELRETMNIHPPSHPDADKEAHDAAANKDFATLREENNSAFDKPN